MSAHQQMKVRHHVFNPKVDRWMRLECYVLPASGTSLAGNFTPSAAYVEVHDDEKPRSSGTTLRCATTFEHRYPIEAENVTERVTRVHVHRDSHPKGDGYGMVAYLGAALYAQYHGFAGVGSFVNTMSRLGRGRSYDADDLWKALERHKMLQEIITGDRASLQILRGDTVRAYLTARAALK